MSDVSIKIKICERTYPMKIKASEEERIREASKNVNDRIAKYIQKFGISDKQDLLAMVAFDCIVEKLTDKRTNTNPNVEKQIKSIISILDSKISEMKSPLI
jgi:cell division protein ZapA